MNGEQGSEGKTLLFTIKLSVTLASNHIYYLIKIKLSNFYRMGKVKWREDVSVKCVKYTRSEKGKRYFK